MRYENQKAEKGAGRFSEMASHDAGYEGMPKTLDYIEQNRLADKLEVYYRSGLRLYTNELKGDRWKNDPKAVEAVEKERARTPTSVEKQQFRNDWKRINHLMEKRQATLREFKEARAVFEKYNHNLEREPEKKTDPAKSRESTDRSAEQKSKDTL